MSIYKYIIGERTITLKNLITAASTSLSDVTLNGYEFSHNPTNVAMVSQSLPTPIANHKYYGRCYQKAPVGYTWADSRFEYYATDAENALMVFTTMPYNPTGDWEFASAITSLSEPREDIAWQLRSFTVAGSDIAYRKELMIIDLTESFGMGLEPSKEWCDENITFFEDEIIQVFPNLKKQIDFENIFLGNSLIEKIYLGSELIFTKKEYPLSFFVKNITVTGNDKFQTTGKAFYTTSGKTIIVFYTVEGETEYISEYNTGSLINGVSVRGTSNVGGSYGYQSGMFFYILEGINTNCNIDIKISGASSVFGDAATLSITESQEKTTYGENNYVNELTFSGTYATSTYFTESECDVGYSEDGETIILMKNGTTTSYENLYFNAKTLLENVFLTNQTGYKDTASKTGYFYACILSGLNKKCNIDIDLSTRSSSSDYVSCYIEMTEI